MKSTPIRVCIAEAQDFARGWPEFRISRGFECGRRWRDTRPAGAVTADTPLPIALEGVEHDAGAVLLHPFGVVALLRHGPCVAHHDDGQPLLHGFADAAGTGLADEEIAELHEIADLRRESDDGARRRAAHRAQLIRERGIVAADQNELRVVQALRDAAHDLRSVAAEHDDTRRPVRIELQLDPLGAPIDVQIRGRNPDE